MKSATTHRQSQRGFTLIELLVVVAIIAVLAAMGFGVGASAIKRAKGLTDRAAAVSLGQAIEGYFDEYSILPVDSGNSDVIVESDSTLMNVLMAFGSEGKSKNPKEIRYYSGKTAKGTSRDKAYGGLFYQGTSQVDLFDAWKKFDSGKIRYYQVALDSNYDDEITDPFKSGRSIYNRRALVWSTGQDGEEARGQENHEKNRDNIYSWKN